MAKKKKAPAKRKISRATRKKISSALKGKKRKPLTSAHRTSISRSLRGRTLSPIHRKRISSGLKKAWKAGKFKGRLAPGGRTVGLKKKSKRKSKKKSSRKKK